MPVVLIIGAGSRVGQSTADAFAAAGYTVAVASRSGKAGSKYKHFPLDASKPETIKNLFSQVQETVGTPSVVIYNAFSDHITKPEKPFDLSVDVFNTDLNVNATSPWVAAGEAVNCFEELGKHGDDDAAAEGRLGKEAASSKAGGTFTFIYTGNLLNITVAPGFLPFGMGKCAAGYLIQHLALVAYNGKPYKFYYADQRHPDGEPMPTGLSGPAHGELYLDLAKDPEQRPWLQTFVEGKGYVEFPRPEVWWPSA